VTPPVFTLIAEANGARKSTLTTGNPETFSPFPLLDPDKISSPLSPAATSAIASGEKFCIWLRIA